MGAEEGVKVEKLALVAINLLIANGLVGPYVNICLRCGRLDEAIEALEKDLEKALEAGKIAK